MRIILVFDEQTDIINSVLFRVQTPKELPQLFFSTRGQHMGVRTNFVREEPRCLESLTKILATCDVEDVSIYLVTLTLEFGAIICERPLF